MDWPEESAELAPEPPQKAPSKRVVDQERRNSILEAEFIESMIRLDGDALACAELLRISKKRLKSMLSSPSFQTRLKERRAEVIAQAMEKTQITVEETLASLARDLRFDPAKLYDQNGVFMPIHEMDEDTRLAIGGSITESGIRGVAKASIRFPDKLAVREQAMKYFGMYEADNRQRAPVLVSGVLSVTPEALSFARVREVIEQHKNGAAKTQLIEQQAARDASGD